MRSSTRATVASAMVATRDFRPKIELTISIQNLLSRSNKSHAEPQLSSGSTVDADFESVDIDFQSRNDFISRPPPLQPRVERELRDACAGILKDLKPSGHDIEDRRMKGDILTHKDPFEFEHNVKAAAVEKQDAARQRRQHSAAAWVMDGREHQYNAFAQARDAKNRQQSASQVEERQSQNVSTDKYAQPMREKSGLTNTDHFPSTEGPLAPIPTNSGGTRHQSLGTSAQPVSSPRPKHRADSTSTDASNPFTPYTDQFKLTSTAPSSAALTSAGSSNRGSETIYTQPATAQDGEWMKQEIQKHKQAQGHSSVSQSVANAANVPSVAGTSDATAIPATRGSEAALPLQERRGSLGARSLSLGSKSGIDATKRPTITSRSSSRQTGMPLSGPAQPTSPTITSHALARHESSSSTASKRHSRSGARLSIDGVPESKISPQPSPHMEEVPPVPRLDAERLNSLTTNAGRTETSSSAAVAELRRQRLDASQEGRQARRPLQSPPLGARSESPPELGAQTTNRSSNSAQPDSRGLSSHAQDSSHLYQPQNRPVTSPAINGQSLGPAIPIRNASGHHQQDGSVTVRDFYRPDHFGPKGRRGKGHDPTPADFDALMSAMDGAVKTPVEQISSSVPISEATSSSSRQNLGPPQNMDLSRSSSTYSSHSDKAPTPTQNGHSKTRQQQTQQLPQHSQTHQQPAIEPIRGPSQTPQPNNSASTDHNLTTPQGPSMVNEISASKRSLTAASQSSIQQSRPTSVLSPGRTSEALSSPSTTNSSKQRKRGLSRLMWKLGGGDMPQRRKIYIAPPEERSIHDGEEYNWDEEEACAAPVVGFGRGW